MNRDFCRIAEGVVASASRCKLKCSHIAFFVEGNSEFGLSVVPKRRSVLWWCTLPVLFLLCGLIVPSVEVSRVILAQGAGQRMSLGY